MKRKIILISLLLSSSSMFAQWLTTGNTIGPGARLGTNNNQPLNIYTNGIARGVWTTGNALGGTVNGISLIAGDGLRILPQAGNSTTSSLDFWTGSSSSSTCQSVSWLYFICLVLPFCLF